MILSFDTSASHCAAALVSDDRTLAARSEDMARGQAERLMPLLAAVLDGAGVHWADLTRIGVGIGPGNFTGVRIAVSAARGLALGLDIPAIGVSTFAAIHLGEPGAVAAVPAPRAQVYLCAPGGVPALVPLAEAGRAVTLDDPARLVERIARVARGTEPGPRPAPLYVRAANAAPSADPPPVILGPAAAGSDHGA
jgi:tRNA threonylcarbamoyl adenosine modification protein YeaZ